MELLQNLNKEQLEAVTFGEGPLLIVAGAGTGKTTVLTQRVAWLIEQGKAQSDEILAVTFTDKAAGEMSERVDHLLPIGYLDLWISTFHSFCQRVLQDHAIDIGLPSDFKLLDQTAQWLLVREHLDKFDLDYYKPLGNPTKFIHALLRHFSRAKDEAVTPDEYLRYVEDLKLNLDQAESTGGSVAKRKKIILSDEQNEIISEISRLEEIANAYHTYQQLLVDHNALDFGDVINYTLQLFQKRPQILKHYQDKFKYVLVDEFQDTNWAQYELIKMLVAPKNNLTVVGDDDQSVYKFRGASVSNIMQFHDDYPKAKVVSITTNYRSLQEILDTSHDFITLNNPNRLEAQSLDGKKVNKRLKAFKQGSAQIEYLKFEDQYDEAAGVVKKIGEILSEEISQGTNLNDFAILVRANSQADDFVTALELAGITYQYVASRGLYTKPVILDLLAFLKLLDDYHESSAMWRFLNWPVFNLSEKVLIGFNHIAKRKSRSLFSVIETVKTSQNYTDAVRSEVTKALDLIQKFSQMALKKKPLEVIYNSLTDSGYLEYLAELGTKQYQQDIAHLNQFITIVKEYEKTTADPSVKGLLAQLNYEIESGETGKLDKDLEAGPEAVKIMTIHAAKGLEFKHVFVVNLVDKRFPSIERKDPIELPEALIKEKIPEGDIHLEEERRLMYVAMTRAKERLFLTGAQDYGGKTKKKPSRFLYELEFVSKEDTKKDKKKTHQLAVAEKKVNEDKREHTIAYELPTKFSFTVLSKFRDCPYQFYLDYILRLPQPGSFHLSFGNSIHLTLQKFFQKFIEQRDNKQADLFGGKEIAESKDEALPTLKELLQLYEESWVDDWYRDARHQADYKERGKKELTEFYKVIKKDIPHVELIEKGFNLKISFTSNTLYSITGKIDRIDRLEDGTLHIIDYKTGEPKTSLDKTAKMQLLMYQLAIEEVVQEKVSKLSYWYLKDNSLRTFIGKEKDLAELRETILQTIKEIKTTDFADVVQNHTCFLCEGKKI